MPRRKADPKKVLVRLEKVSKDYTLRKSRVLHAIFDIDLEILSGEFVSITGPSGAGKSTILNLLALLDKPSSGTIAVNNKVLNKLSERQAVKFRLDSVGIVFQFFNLIDNLTAIDNIIFQLRLQGYAKSEAREKAEKILKFMGLKDKANIFPKKLSGGEQQRIAIGRAMAKDSLLMLVDEPTAHLDSKNGQAVMQTLREVNKKFGKTIVLVSHEMNYAKMADRVVHLKDGRIERITSGKK